MLDKRIRKVFRFFIIAIDNKHYTAENKVETNSVKRIGKHLWHRAIHLNFQQVDK